MNNAITRFSLDLDQQDSQVYVTVRKGDTAKGLSVMLKESGTPYSIAAGTTAVLAARKPDGTYITACNIHSGSRETGSVLRTIGGRRGTVFPALHGLCRRTGGSCHMKGVN